MQALDGHAQAAERRSEQADSKLEKALAEYSDLAAKSREELQRLDSRFQQLTARTEQTFEEWRAAEIKRAVQLRAHVESVIPEQIKALQRRTEATEATVRATSESVEQLVARVEGIDRAMGVHLTNVWNTVTADRAAWQQAMGSLDATVTGLRGEIIATGRRQRQSAMMAYAFTALMGVIAVAIAVLLGMGVLKL